jgi:hypothetical protein
MDMGDDLNAMLAALEGRPQATPIDWQSCRTSLRGVLDMLDDAGHAASPVAIHVADALVQVEYRLAYKRLAA